MLTLEHILPMQLCCIDVGTNSVLFLSARIDSKGRITPLEFHAETTRLGESLRKNGILTKQAQARTISAIKKNIGDADKYIIAGTSALREAKNRKEFTRLLYKETGQHIRILTEEEEAELVFRSVSHFLKPIPKKTIICDIGGGSTEFIYCVNGRLIKKISIPIGAVNLTERFRNNISDMESFVIDATASCCTPKFLPIKTLIAVGGTVTTLGAILKRLRQYQPDKVHKYIVPLHKVVSTLKKLNSLPLSKRRRIITFDPKRADIIVAGLCILKTVMEVFNVDKFKICDRGLVYGLAVNYAKYTRGTFNLQSIS